MATDYATPNPNPSVHLPDSHGEPLCGTIMAAGMDAMVGDPGTAGWPTCPTCQCQAAFRDAADSESEAGG